MEIKDTINVKRGGVNEKVFLYSEIDELYPKSIIVNRTLNKIRSDINVWVESDILKQINVEILVEDTDIINACATKKKDNKYYIIVTRGLLLVGYNEISNFLDSTQCSDVYHLSIENIEVMTKQMYSTMITFIVAHEFGHIVDGHIDSRYKSSFYLDEINCDEIDEKWKTQLREYDADRFATKICSGIFLILYKGSPKMIKESFDNLGIVLLLIFNMLSKSRQSTFDEYMTLNIYDMDYPHPGIRMHYCFVTMISVLLNEINQEEVKEIASYITDGIVRADKYILYKEKYKECVYAVATTKKGAQHIMQLVNDWNEVADFYDEYSFIPIQKTDDIEFYPYAVDKEGNFIIE